MQRLGQLARDASRSLSRTDRVVRDSALRSAATVLRQREDDVLQANRVDVRDAERRGIGSAMLDRLMLDPQRVDAMAAGLEAIAELDDPLQRTLATWSRPNGLTIARVSVPLGVIGIIYESRPNVTADAAGLCIKSGNAVILRGGSESFHSSRAIHACLTRGLTAAGLDPACVQMLPTTDRAAVGYLLSSMGEWLDVVVPRGGKNLIRRVQDEARVPVIGHLDGICHVYLHESADTAMAVDIAVNAKMRRPGICGAAETMLVDRAAAERLLPAVTTALADLGCELRGDDEAMRLAPGLRPATEEDWRTEYLDAILSLRVVDDIDAAMAHIAHYGSGHTECIVSDDEAAADRFFRNVDSAILLHNASTQFADGGEFGMGAEIGIATGRLHARGPVGANELTSYKYVVRGSGQVRP